MKANNRNRDFHSSNLFKEKSPTRQQTGTFDAYRSIQDQPNVAYPLMNNGSRVPPNSVPRSSYTQIFNSDDTHWKRNSFENQQVVPNQMMMMPIMMQQNTGQPLMMPYPPPNSGQYPMNYYEGNRPKDYKTVKAKVDTRHHKSQEQDITENHSFFINPQTNGASNPSFPPGNVPFFPFQQQQYETNMSKQRVHPFSKDPFKDQNRLNQPQYSYQGQHSNYPPLQPQQIYQQTYTLPPINQKGIHEGQSFTTSTTSQKSQWHDPKTDKRKQMKQVAEMVRNASAGFSDSSDKEPSEHEEMNNKESKKDMSKNRYYNPNHSHVGPSDKGHLKDWIDSTASSYPMKETRLMRTMAIKTNKPSPTKPSVYSQKKLIDDMLKESEERVASKETSPARNINLESLPFPSVHETINEDDENVSQSENGPSIPIAIEEATQTEVPVSIIKYPYFSDSMLPSSMISHLVLKFLLRNNFKQTANVFSQESGISFYEEQDKTLRESISTLKFDEAISHVRATYFSLMASRRIQMKRSNYVNRLKSAFQDLLYILNKYLFIKFVKDGFRDKAWDLLSSDMKAFLTNDRDATSHDKSRREWYQEDMLELQALIGKDAIPEKDRERLGLTMDIGESGKAIEPDWFKLWDWSKELETFWHVAFQVYHNRMVRRINHACKSNNDKQPMEIPPLPQVPLFAHVLADYFMDRTPLLSLEVLLSICLSVIRDDEKSRRCLEPEASAVIPNLKNPWSLWPLWTEPFIRKYSGLNEGISDSVQNPGKNDDSYYIPMNSTNSLDSIASFGRKTSAGALTKYKFENAGKQMLSMPLRCLDITISTTSHLLVTTGEDKKITSWEVYPEFRMVDQWVHPLIQKTIIYMSFHPTIADWLLTMDSEKTLIWWSLSQKEPLQVWRKCHSHVVHHVSFIPVNGVSRAGSGNGNVVSSGGGHRAVTCSADHSIKIWKLDEAKGHFASLHANAPFTAIAFMGGMGGSEESLTTSNGQIMLAAQPKGIIRMYKMKTLALIKVIHVDIFRDSPICFIHNHPKDPAGKLLLTGERHEMIGMYSITDEKMIKTYSARGYSGSRLNPARFSPCGNFIYADSPTPINSNISNSSSIVANLHESYKVYMWRTDTAKTVNGGALGTRIKNAPGKTGISKELLFSNSLWFYDVSKDTDYVISWALDGNMYLFQHSDEKQ